MGYQVGKGLGKLGTGIIQPVEESIQKGRRGLGYMLEGLEKEDVQWEQEEVRLYNDHGHKCIQILSIVLYGKQTVCHMLETVQLYNFSKLYMHTTLAL